MTVDVVGLPRFFDDPDVPDTGAGLSPPYVDMGAYERIPITVTTLSNQTLCSGSSAVFTVTATGQPTLTYRWRKNGVNLTNGGTISGVTTDTLTINPTGHGRLGQLRRRRDRRLRPDDHVQPGVADASTAGRRRRPPAADGLHGRLRSA